MELLKPYLGLMAFFYLPTLFFDEEFSVSISSMIGIFSCGIRQVFAVTTKKAEVFLRQPRPGSSASRFKDVKKKSQRTFKKLIESPTQTPYFVCIPMYWGLLLITPLLPKCLKIPWVLHCSLDQFIVLFSWWRCYRNFHRRGLRDEETFDQTDNKYLLVEDFVWKQQLEEECFNLRQLTEMEITLYSIESPHIVHSYMDIEEGAERLIRARKAAVLQELREKLAKQMTKIQGLTKQCAQTVGQNQPSSFKP
ncbi:uncharacterized protein LOC116966842 [Amblyraja radiata]|uniref:uncharacterized protein LOC116966842 n=1 Tax=Amblyraja radiata TaxID=386614 RepID=UPI001403E614|nr:uncharacterized protein LOC116966842 [Amblyraja radiata]XP_032869074.1 uncharacterized protein LOC116966842 [Amblyraja radiata]XP_055519448.1 uncharacterized protein LOC129714007 isoform X1 [Leucoraja erinacea]XP_055519449.1 uncharacterized protein LOC129714007 isoform X1 [Leucoraja erinacea]XP_055519450.1 uncharacterized protein LOC129714007 isoform X1 [Leucoraja erinacea]XP_055519451.1 uncharacterized protein LOC129714007 isoform X1 [Leucoraja erinacea]XP_055519452.1 uncharacterized prot